MNDNMWAALIGAGVQVGTTAANNYSIDARNSDSRGFSKEMYGISRMDALRDRDYNNWYNSPAQLMGRMADAGLNPNLLATGGAASSGQSQMPRSSEIKSWEPQAKDFSGLNRVNPLMEFNNLQLQQAQLDNLKASQDLKVQEKYLKTASTAGILIKNAKSEVDLKSARELQEISVEYGKENLRKLQADTQFTLDENIRKAASNTASLSEILERTLLLQKQQAQTDAQRSQIDQQIKNLKVDKDIKEEELKLRKQGIQPGDNILYRKAAEILGRLGLGSALNNFGENIKGKLYEWGNIAPWFR